MSSFTFTFGFLKLIHGNRRLDFCFLPAAGCKIYVLDISEMAHFLGYPRCDVARFVTDPEFGTILPNATHLLPNKFNSTPPMEQYTGMYPFNVLPHYESLNAGACALPLCLLANDAPHLVSSLSCSECMP